MADTTQTKRTAPPFRASDADRHSTALLLQDAMARGLLTPEEGDERMAAAFAAVHQRDLSPLTADLPPVKASSNPKAGWRVLLLVFFEQFKSFFVRRETGRLKPSRVAVAFLLAAALVLA